MNHLALARKWRPKTFAEVIGQPQVVRALSNALNQQYLHHAYLFTGTRGVGKTTIARILAKCLNCLKGISAIPCGECEHCQEIDAGRFIDLYEVDAASRTKVEDTRELLDNVQYAPTKGRYKVYLIDEVHMLSGHSFNALLKTLEEPPPHVKFLLATTDYQRLPATVLSRCLQFHLMQMPPQQISEHLQTILTQEKIQFENDATLLLGKAANGSMRDALSLLDQSIAYGNGEILTADIKTILGYIEVTALYNILEALAKQDPNALLNSAAQLLKQGADFNQALADLLSLLHQITIIQLVADGPQQQTPAAELKALAQQMHPEDVQLYYQIGLHGQRDLAFAPTAQSGFEMTLLRMLAFSPQQSTTQAAPIKKKHVDHAKTAPKTATITPHNTDTEWNELLAKLNITGPTHALATHCALKTMTEHELTLTLDPKHQPLLHKKHIERLNEALTQHLNTSMIVHIEVVSSDEATPADITKQKQQQQQTAAEKAIHSDESVQRIIQKFDATIIKDSIAPIEQEQ